MIVSLVAYLVKEAVHCWEILHMYKGSCVSAL